jgi:hypothetical protein
VSDGLFGFDGRWRLAAVRHCGRRVTLQLTPPDVEKRLHARGTDYAPAG